MSKKLVSIIIPIYNIEDYLPRCLDSILAQTYQDIEIICINDGSTDRSGEICDCYQQKDTRIIVQHQENKGVSSARNVGLSICRGDWISFVDGDDWIASDMIENLYNQAQANSSQIAIIGYAMVWGVGGKLQKVSDESLQLVMNHDEALSEFFSQRLFKGFMWDKLFKKELFDGISFPENISFMEDVSIGYKLFDKCTIVSYNGKIGYFYLQREGSATNNDFNPLRTQSAIDVLQEMIEFCINKGYDYREELSARYVMINFLAIVGIYSLKNDKYVSLEARYLQSIRKKKKYINSHYINCYNRTCLWLMMIGVKPRIVIKVRNSLLNLRRVRKNAKQ